MRERPIIFSGPMVKAILEGRKTQTRRVVKPQPETYQCDSGLQFEYPHWHGSLSAAQFTRYCPHGKPGDRLWVRETWYCDHIFAGDIDKSNDYRPPRSEEQIRNEWREMLYYRADGEMHQQMEQCEKPDCWRSPLYMPRWASRLLLEVTSVRVQRLQEISEDDATAEGIPDWTSPEQTFSPRVRLQKLWDSINAKRGYHWASNPWVWALTFKKVSP